jgi:hypothetical protein
MKYLKIQNNGILDIRLVALMGGTTKANDEYKIGQFGTGLKYTLAFLYRNNLDFKIFAGSKEVKLHTEIETIRDEDFEIICINGQRTSITTRMGESWDAWMIVREIWCNALDEGGAQKEIVTDITGVDNCTTFFIQIDSQVQKVLDQWEKYFIHHKEPLYKNDHHAIYPGGDKLRLYKNGVLIYESEQTDQPALFAYDILNADINELREFKGHKQYEITQALAAANERVATYFLENIKEKYFEGSDQMSYSWWQTWSVSWKNVLGSAKIIHQKAKDDIEARGIEIDTTSTIVVPVSIYTELTKQFKGIGALTVAAKACEFYEQYNKQVEDRVKQGLTILEHCEYIMHPELKFVYGFFEDKRVQARVNLDERKVYISQTLLQKPLFTIVAVLVEENEHFNTGMADHTREFQQHFIDMFTRALLAKHEVEV